MLAHANSPGRVSATPGDIATYAGGGVGDGASPLNAATNAAGVATDGAGNLYIADNTNCRVRKLTASGVISTIAGTGVCGYSGDGSAATAARVNFPQSVAVTPGGDILIADSANCRIRRIDGGGTISTFAGGSLCIYGGDGGPATSAFLAGPDGVAVSPAGDVYIADTDNCRVRKVAGGIITTFAGTGACGSGGDGGPATAAGVGRASGVMADAVGNVYIADTSSCRVRIVSTASIIGTLAGSGTCAYTGDGMPAYAAGLNKPRAIALDAAGDLLIADTDNCRIRKVTYPTLAISTVAGDGDCNIGGDGGSASFAKLSYPRGIAVSGTTLHIGDTNNCRVRRVTASVITTTAGTGWCQYGGDGGPATNAALSTTGEVAVDAAGNLYIADINNCRIRKVDTGGMITTFAGNGACAYAGDGGLATGASLNGPRGVAVDSAGVVYVADSSNCRIRRISGGVITTFAGSGACGYSGDGSSAIGASLSYPQGVAVFGSTVYIADSFNCRVRRVSGGVITTFAGDGACLYDGDGGTPGAASLTFPHAVSADATGVYIADTYNCRVRKVAGGAIATIAGTGACPYGGDGGPATAASLDQPMSVAGSGGSAYIADTDNCRLRVVAGETIISVAGTGFCEFGGEGGSAASALLNRPAGIAVSGSGDVFVSDGANRRVRRVAAGSDADGDGIASVADNCPSVANVAQTNSDRNFIDMGPLPADDTTRARSDLTGDACDPDDDNDGLPDTSESAGCNSSGALNPLISDTDGDRTLDNAECMLGSNPGVPSSVPPFIVGPDADNDGVPDTYDPNDAAADSDGDKVSDRSEFRHYNTNLASSNTDADVCSDGKEVASINNDTTVNVADRGITASRFGSSTTPQYLVQLDFNKDGTINVADVGLVALNFGPC